MFIVSITYFTCSFVRVGLIGKLNSVAWIFSVTGYGHGVGMSQTGADSMAKTGANYETIIKHFYTGVEIIELKFL